MVLAHGMNPAEVSIRSVDSMFQWSEKHAQRASEGSDDAPWWEDG